MKKLIIFALLSLLFAGCSAENTADDKPDIFVSFYAVENFAKEIVQDKADITTLAQNGSMHDFEISASQMAKLSRADLFIYSGDADHWAKDISKTAEDEGCKTLSLAPEESEDPHTWLDPDNAIEQIEMIYLAMCDISPENSEYFKENFDSAKEKYLDLKERTQSLLPKTEGKTIVVSHGAYGHLLGELKVKQLAIEGIHSEGDPTAAHMAEIIDYIKEHNIKYIFTSPNESSKTAEAIAGETGAKILQLDSMESDNQGGSYFEIMEKNLDIIEQSLDG